jgi:gliding motility-associated-like protein
LDPTCTFQLNFFIGSSFNVSAIIQVDKETSCGANDALINILSVSGGQNPYQFMLLDTLNDTLEPFQPITSTIDSLSPGQYQLVIMDANNCQITILVTINGLVAPSATPVELQAVTCYGGSNGILSLNNSQGGSGVYVYGIDGGAFQSDTVFNNLEGGQHILTINDVNTSCSDNYTFNLSEPDSLSFSINQTDLALCGDNIGSLTVQNATGGNGPYTFEIIGASGPQSSPIFDSLFVGQYTLEMSDLNSCTKSMVFEVDGTQPLTYDVISNEISCPDNADGSIAISNFAGGVSPFAVSVNNGTTFTSPSSSDVLIASLEAGVYTILIRDSINCLYTDTSPINIENPEPIFANTENITMTEIDSSNGRIAIYDITGGTAPYMISVNADSFFAVNFNQLTATYDTVLNNFSGGYQTLEIKDLKNCIETFEVYIESYEFAGLFTIPNIFTPNSDGYNDTFVIKKLPSNSKLYIYDKNGRPVYENENYRNDWDAGNLPDGTYFFTLEVENQGVYRGYVEVFR